MLARELLGIMLDLYLSCDLPATDLHLPQRQIAAEVPLQVR
jgi:hypothetical protein